MVELVSIDLAFAWKFLWAELFSTGDPQKIWTNGLFGKCSGNIVSPKIPIRLSFAFEYSGVSFIAFSICVVLLNGPRLKYRRLFCGATATPLWMVGVLGVSGGANPSLLSQESTGTKLNPPDETGKTSISIPWRKLDYYDWKTIKA